MKEIPHLPEAFAQVLQEARDQARLSQQDLADKVNCARSFVSFMETKTNLPGLNAFMVIADGLGVQPDELLRRVSNRLKAIDYAKSGPI